LYVINVIYLVPNKAVKNQKKKQKKNKKTVGRHFQSLSIVFLCAVNTKLASLFGLEFSLQKYIELSGVKLATHETPE
jgi:hypothetical protein